MHRRCYTVAKAVSRVDSEFDSWFIFCFNAVLYPFTPGGFLYLIMDNAQRNPIYSSVLGWQIASWTDWEVNAEQRRSNYYMNLDLNHNCARMLHSQCECHTHYQSQKWSNYSKKIVLQITFIWMSSWGHLLRAVLTGTGGHPSACWDS